MTEKTNGWQLFDKISIRSARMRVTIYKNGQVSLTRAVRDALGTDSVELLFNPTERKIGIRPAASAEGAFKLRRPKRQRSYLLSGSAFLNHYDLNELRGKKFPAVIEGEMIVISIK